VAQNRAKDCSYAHTELDARTQLASEKLVELHRTAQCKILSFLLALFIAPFSSPSSFLFSVVAVACRCCRFGALTSLPFNACALQSSGPILGLKLGQSLPPKQPYAAAATPKGRPRRLDATAPLCLAGCSLHSLQTATKTATATRHRVPLGRPADEQASSKLAEIIIISPGRQISA